MLFLLFLGVLFVGFFFYKLSNKYNKSILWNTVLGILVFLISYFISSFVLILFINTWIRVHFFNETLIACFTIPISILISAVVYKFIENNLRKRKAVLKVEDIGKKIE